MSLELYKNKDKVIANILLFHINKEKLINDTNIDLAIVDSFDFFIDSAKEYLLEKKKFIIDKTRQSIDEKISHTYMDYGELQSYNKKNVDIFDNIHFAVMCTYYNENFDKFGKNKNKYKDIASFKKAANEYFNEFNALLNKNFQIPKNDIEDKFEGIMNFLLPKKNTNSITKKARI